MVQVGDTAWIRAKAGLKLSDGEVWFTDLIGTPIKNTDGQFIPDLPGVDLAALVELFAEVGVENVVDALEWSATLCSNEKAPAIRRGARTCEWGSEREAFMRNAARQWDGRAAINRRLAAALGGGK